MDGFRSMMSLT